MDFLAKYNARLDEWLLKYGLKNFHSPLLFLGPAFIRQSLSWNSVFRCATINTACVVLLSVSIVARLLTAVFYILKFIVSNVKCPLCYHTVEL